MKRISVILLSVAAIALSASTALGYRGGFHGSGPPHGPGHEPDPAGFVMHHADRLGLDDATLESIEAIVASSREQSDGLRTQLRAAHERMRQLLEADVPDEAAVLAQASTIGGLETELHQTRLRALLQIRGLLTPEQRAELQRIRDEGPFARFRAAREACTGDVAQLCPDAPDEGPHALFCLKDQREALSDACREALQDLPSRHDHHHRKAERGAH